MTTTANTKNVVLLSKKGMKELKKSIARLERKQQQLIAGLRELEKTDIHEHRLARSERISALEMVETELADRQALLGRAKLFPRKRDALVASLGSIVELVDMKGRIFRYTLVDSIEANPSDGRISVKSPLGQSLIGRTIRDTIEWGNGLRSGKLQLVKIM